MDNCLLLIGDLDKGGWVCWRVIVGGCDGVDGEGGVDVYVSN